MQDLRKIEQEISEVKDRLKNLKGRPTEVYTRIVGYYRSVVNWNRGKREEYGERRAFEPNNREPDRAIKEKGRPDTRENIHVSADSDQILYFFRQSCPNCPSVKRKLDQAGVAYQAIDVDSPAGVTEAQARGVMSVPTVIGLANNNEESVRALNSGELKRFLEPIAG